MNFCTEKFKGDPTIAPDQMSNILSVLLNHDNHPLFVHCLDGSNVTGLAIMCLRKMQMWKRPVIVTEFTRFLGGENPEEEELLVRKHTKHTRHTKTRRS